MTVSGRFLAPLGLQEQIVRVRDIQWDNERHAVKIGGLTIVLTLTEYRLLSPLRYGTPVTYADLAMMTYGYTVDEKVRIMMDKHIDRIRGKLRGTGIYVYCVLSYGYLLLPETPLAEPLPDLPIRESSASAARAQA